MESAITSKGQTTIPKPIREHLGLAAGDRVKFFIHPDGTVVLLPKAPVSAMRGMLRKPGRRTASLEEMQAAIAAGAARAQRRQRSR